jgi:hypothetical protein
MHADEPSELLKRDVLGRVTATKAQREALLDGFERSGLKGKPFARVAGVNYQTFASWIQKRRRARGDDAPGVGNELLERRAIKPVQSLYLLEAVVAQPASTLAPEAPPNNQVLEVLLPGGAKLLIANAPQVALAAQLIAALAKLC